MEFNGHDEGATLRQLFARTYFKINFNETCRRSRAVSTRSGSDTLSFTQIAEYGTRYEISVWIETSIPNTIYRTKSVEIMWGGKHTENKHVEKEKKKHLKQKKRKKNKIYTTKNGKKYCVTLNITNKKKITWPNGANTLNTKINGKNKT